MTYRGAQLKHTLSLQERFKLFEPFTKPNCPHYKTYTYLGRHAKPPIFNPRAQPHDNFRQNQ